MHLNMLKPVRAENRKMTMLVQCHWVLVELQQNIVINEETKSTKLLLRILNDNSLDKKKKQCHVVFVFVGQK